ncbi:hypothetical protein COV24_02530 [candidate division WWE3 bacterium CG10_big_fil_rev_8_21_14_0_10_32_10]|uniref:M23ase beta-sheet core domain-containing protein n=1 Tax=candidate division WWE3 bacterium CG10_big_fil_rev_8_21_14_0_10_32_10 TaxID=1975090 RepID=A0A2H0RAF1_UNCKA|nr:MAG: hypothetical protein COV24_02530 [candidate division WWE3 bacterium CG10_big_fil_rev_8_21_14_0_10_32_10]
MAQRYKPNQRRGPGRPMRPSGPLINAKNTIDIPNELFENWFTDILSGKDLESWGRMSQESKDAFIGGIKSALFTVRARAGAYNPADSNLVYLGEYGDLAGVQVTFDLEKAWKDPIGYLKTLPSTYLKGVIRLQDIEREIEKKVLQQVMEGGYIKEYGKPTPPPGQGKTLLPSGNGAKILDVQKDPNTGKPTSVRGRDGIPAYMDLSKAVNGWVDLSQVQGLRDTAKDSLTSSVHKIFAKEFSYQGNNSWDKKDEILVSNNIDTLLSNTNNQEIKDFFTDYKNKESYKKAINASLFKDSAGNDYTLKKLLDFTQVSLTPEESHLQNAKASYNNFFGEEVATEFVTGKAYEQSPFLRKLHIDLKNNWQAAGFSSSNAVDDMFKIFTKSDIPGIRATNLEEYISYISNKIAFNKDVTSADAYRFREILETVNENTVEIQKSIRSSLESKLQYHSQELVDNIISEMPNTVSQQVKDEIKERMLAAVDLKKYVAIRNDMESIEEFLTAVGKGEIWKRYFFGGVYNKDLPLPFGLGKYIQDINARYMKTKIPGTNYRLMDIQNGIVGARNVFFQKIGFTGEAMSTPGLLAWGSNNTTLYTTNFNPRAGLNYSLIKNNKDTTLNLYQSGKSYDRLFQTQKGFAENLKQFNSGAIYVSAKDFTDLPTSLEAIEAMGNNYLPIIQSPLAAGLPTRHMNDLHGIFTGFYTNPSTLSKNHFLFTNMPQADFDRYKQSLDSLFIKLKKYENMGIDPDDMLSFVLDISFEKKFVEKLEDGTFVFKRYLPALNYIAKRLSALQTYGLYFLHDKILVNTLFKWRATSWISKNIWDVFYNPKYGPVRWAESIVTKLSTKAWAVGIKSALRPFWGLIQKILPSFLTTATAGTAYLAVIAQRFGQALLASIWKVLKGDLKGVVYEFKRFVEDVLIKPVKFIVNFIVKPIIIVFVVLVLFITLFIAGGGLLAQSNRPVNTESGDYGENYPLFVDNNNNLCFSAATGNTVNGSIAFIPGLAFGLGSITSCPGWRTFDGKSNFHTGVDFGVDSVNLTSPVEGDIVFAGWSPVGYGNLVIIKSDFGGVSYYFYFAHLKSITKFSGSVKLKDQIGVTGNTGNSTGPHLHFEVRVGGRDVLSVENPCTVPGISCDSSCLSSSFEGAVCK